MEIFKGQGGQFSISGGRNDFEKTKLMHNLSVLRAAYYLPHPLRNYREEIKAMRQAIRILPLGIYIIIKLILA